MDQQTNSVKTPETLLTTRTRVSRRRGNKLAIFLDDLLQGISTIRTLPTKYK